MGLKSQKRLLVIFFFTHPVVKAWNEILSRTKKIWALSLGLHFCQGALTKHFKFAASLNLTEFL